MSIKNKILSMCSFSLLLVIGLSACTKLQKRMALERDLYKVLNEDNSHNVRDTKQFKDIYKKMENLNGTSIFNVNIFLRYSRVLSKYFKPSDTVMLEIGPGNNLLSGVLFALNGINKYYAVDIYRPKEFYNPTPFNTLSLMLKKLYPDIPVIPQDKVYTIVNNKVQFNSDKIEYIYPHSVDSFPMKDNSVDFVFSNTCFEHFEYPGKAVKRIYSVLKKGGITAHKIDFRNHDDFSKPYDLLKYSRKEWRKRYSADRLHLYNNQWRLIDFLESFKNNGFKILKVDKELPPKEHMLTKELRKTFHKDFGKYTFEQLLPTQAFIVAKKE